jgi:hypothetical protein
MLMLLRVCKRQAACTPAHGTHAAGEQTAHCRFHRKYTARSTKWHEVVTPWPGIGSVPGLTIRP